MSDDSTDSLRGLRRWVCYWLLAVQFYTRIPITGRLALLAPYCPESLTRSTCFFPLVGCLVGALGAGLYLLAHLWVPAGLAIGLSMAATVLITGAFHEDGWADFCDAFGTHADRAKTLQIMTDSRIGVYGAVALILILGLKYLSLSSIDAGFLVAVMICAHAASRGFAVVVMRSLAYAKPDDESKSKPIAQSLSARDAAIAWGFALFPCLFVILKFDALLPIMTALGLGTLGTLWMVGAMKKRLQGFTGDGLGATQQLTELLFLLGTVPFWKHA